MKIRTMTRILLVLAVLAGTAGCSNFEPWVKPYERDRLADPIMALDTDPVSSSYIMHVYESREGARGSQRPSNKGPSRPANGFRYRGMPNHGSAR